MKQKNFCPNPVVKYGIPDYADSSKDKKVIGTAAWEDWWLEQFYHCINGYNVGGIVIPGRYYYYLNFCMMSTVGIGNHYPMYVDLDYEFFLLVEEAKRTNMGIISPKARRRGLSFKVISVCDHGMRFSEKYEAGICAGLQTHADGFYKKFRHSNSLKHNELRMNIKLGDEEAVHKYRVKKDGIWNEEGTWNAMYIKTMYTNPGGFKGEKLEDCVFEESGEFPLLLEAFEATKHCFMFSDMMIGTPYIYGTGSKMKNSKGFKEMYYNAESFGLLRFVVPGTRLNLKYVGGIEKSVMNPKGKIKEDTPNLQQYKPYERIGMEDVQRAEEAILYNRKVKAKNPNKKAYYEDLQNNPLNIKEIFLSFGGNDFDTEILNDKLYNIYTDGKKYVAYEINWVKTESGALKQPLEVELRTLTDEELSDKDFIDRHHVIYILHKPRPDYDQLDIAGIDSYDLDQSMTSKSLGSMTVYRRKHKIPNLSMEIPIALVNYRPKKKEIFYSTCAMASVYYNLLGNVNLDIANSQIIKHFEELGLISMFCERPRKFESPDSTQQHTIGTKLTTYSKPLMIGLLQSYVAENGHKIEFDMMLQEFVDYDTTATESDWDNVDSFGLALMRDADMEIDPDKIDDDEDMYMEEWIEDNEGNLVRTNTKVDKSIKDPFLQMLQQGKI